MKRKMLVRMGAFGVSVMMSIAVMSTLSISAAPTEFDDEIIEEAAVSSMARTMSVDADTQALPASTSRTSVNINGRQMLSGSVLVIDNITYVPMFKFASWLGVFNYSSSDSGYVTTANISGQNLKITAVENSLYIIANGRYFYTVGEVKEIGGEMYVPIEPLVKALNCRASKSSYGTYSVSSGDSRLLKDASAVYRDDEVYWLSRIISAEAKGESLRGKIAVGNVILNRVRSNLYPGTIYGVIFDKRYGVQFAPTANGMIYAQPTAESIIAAKICLEGYSMSNDILYFFNPRYTSGTWVKNNREYAFTIGNHVFYN